MGHSTRPASDAGDEDTDAGDDDPSRLEEALIDMGETYRDDPETAVRGQHFVKILHEYIGDALRDRFNDRAKRRGLEVVYEAKIFGSTKPKKVDVAVVDPENGPLILIGVRSQMSSISKNVLNYYEGIVGECASIQDRFPMATHGYVYLHPLNSIKEGKKDEVIDNERYAKLYNKITARRGPKYTDIRGVFDHFAYIIVDFEKDPPSVRDDIIDELGLEHDLSIKTFVDRIVKTINDRDLFINYLE